MSTTAYLLDKKLGASLNENSKIKHSILPASIGAGVISASIQNALLPSECKMALKCCKYPMDLYIAKSEKCAVETMKNTGKQFNLNNIKENAAQLYKDFTPLKKVAVQKIAKSFLLAASAVAGIGLLINRKAAKNTDKSKN